MTKTEIAKRLREIADNLELARQQGASRGRNEDKVLALLDASIDAETEITDLILKFNAGKLPRKTPVRSKSADVFYIEATIGYVASANFDAWWNDKPLKKKLTTTRGWQREFDDYVANDAQPVDLRVLDANKKLIARFCRDLDGDVTQNKGR